MAPVPMPSRFRPVTRTETRGSRRGLQTEVSSRSGEEQTARLYSGLPTSTAVARELLSPRTRCLAVQAGVRTVTRLPSYRSVHLLSMWRSSTSEAEPLGTCAVRRAWPLNTARTGSCGHDRICPQPARTPNLDGRIHWGSPRARLAIQHCHRRPKQPLRRLSILPDTARPHLPNLRQRAD